MPASFNFDGVTDHLNYGDVAIFDGLTAFSFSGWIKWDSLKAGQGVFGKSIGAGERFYHYVEGNKRFFMNVDGVNGSRDAMYWGPWESNTDIGVWYHYVFTWEGGTTNNWTLYVDGDSKSLTVHAVGNADAIKNSADPLILGDLTTSGTWDFAGNMSDVKMFNRKLSQDEVLELMHTPDSIVDGLIFDAPLRDTAATDRHNGNSPTITGATTSVEGPPVFFPELKRG